MGKRDDRMNQKRADALRAAVKLFLSQGYHQTRLDQISKEINCTTASLLRAYPDKEAILYALVTHMFSAQFGNVRILLGKDADPLMVYGVETALQLNICELSEALRDLYVTAYTLHSTCDYIFHNTSKELQNIFSEYLPHAEASSFYELEVVSGGIMRSCMARKCDLYFTIERKLRLFLDSSFKIYEVPVEKRELIISKILSMDIGQMAQRIVSETVKLAESGFSPEVLSAIVKKE